MKAGWQCVLLEGFRIAGDGPAELVDGVDSLANRLADGRQLFLHEGLAEALVHVKGVDLEANMQRVTN